MREEEEEPYWATARGTRRLLLPQAQAGQADRCITRQREEGRCKIRQEGHRRQAPEQKSRVSI